MTEIRGKITELAIIEESVIATIELRDEADEPCGSISLPAEKLDDPEIGFRYRVSLHDAGVTA